MAVSTLDTWRDACRLPGPGDGAVLPAVTSTERTRRPRRPRGARQGDLPRVPGAARLPRLRGRTSARCTASGAG